VSDWKHLIEEVFAKDKEWAAELRLVSDLLASLGETRDPSSQEYAEQHDQLSGLTRDKGWSRRKAYALFFEQLQPDMPHEDLVGNFLDGLCGWCDVDYVMRFDGDPEDPQELAGYARGTAWMHEDRYSARSEPPG
jgi:hypothetical protein